MALIRLRCSHLRLHIVRFFLFLLLLLFYVRQGEEAGSRDQAELAATSAPMAAIDTSTLLLDGPTFILSLTGSRSLLSQTFATE